MKVKNLIRSEYLRESSIASRTYHLDWEPDKLILITNLTLIVKFLGKLSCQWGPSHCPEAALDLLSSYPLSHSLILFLSSKKEASELYFLDTMRSSCEDR